MPSSSVPGPVFINDWSLWMWVRPDVPVAGDTAIIEFPGAVSVRLGADASPVVTIERSAGAQSLSVSPGAPVPGGQWSLLVASYRRTAGTLDVWMLSEAATVVSQGAWAPTGSSMLLAATPISLGATADGALAMRGVYGLVALRNHAATLADAQAVFDSRRFLGPYDTDTTADGGEMTGAAGAAWMINHSMTTTPLGDPGGTADDRAACVGCPVGVYNYHVFSRVSGPNDDNDKFRWVIAADAASDLTYLSHRDGDAAGFFTTDIPSPGVWAPAVEGVSPRARELATRTPTALTKIIISANSRGAGANGYWRGFFEDDREHVAGVILRPFTTIPQEWPGFDAPTGIRTTGGTPPRTDTAFYEGGWDFSRFFTGSMQTGQPGPGAGLFLPGGVSATLRCRPEPGTLISATSPLAVEAYALRFPGACDIQVRPSKGLSQTDAGTLSSPWVVPMDTTTLVRTLGEGEGSATGNTEIVLLGDKREAVTPGDAVFVAAGPGRGSISIVADASFDGQATLVFLERPLSAAAAAGSTLRFGPWELISVEYQWPALAPEDPQIYRGLRIEAVADAPSGRVGTPVYAISAWRPDVAGFALGGAGWGGHGYQVQLAGMFPAAASAWMTLTRADLWIQAPAQQGSAASSMSDFAQVIREALPAAELVWAGDSTHPAASFPDWLFYISEHAADFGAIGVQCWQHPLIGTNLEQYVGGLRSNGAHYSSWGVIQIARAWSEAIELATRPPPPPDCPADFNGDGTVNTADFFEFFAAFFATPPDADVSGDGVTDTADFFEFFAAFFGPPC